MNINQFTAAFEAAWREAENKARDDVSVWGIGLPRIEHFEVFIGSPGGRPGTSLDIQNIRAMGTSIYIEGVDL